jgi:hypothetical protein
MRVLHRRAGRLRSEAEHHQQLEICKDNMAKTEQAGQRVTYGVTVLAGLE